MTYNLTIPIDAPTMTVAQAIAWSVLKLLPSGTAFAAMRRSNWHW